MSQFNFPFFNFFNLKQLTAANPRKIGLTCGSRHQFLENAHVFEEIQQFWGREQIRGNDTVILAHTDPNSVHWVRFLSQNTEERAPLLPIENPKP